MLAGNISHYEPLPASGGFQFLWHTAVSKNIPVSTRTRKNPLYHTPLRQSRRFRVKNLVLRLLGILLDGQAPAEYNIYQTNITESHKQKNRKQNMADTKIKPQHHPAGRSFKLPLSVRLFLSLGDVPLCPHKGPWGLSGQDPRSTLVETPLQISLFFAKQTQFQNGQYEHKYSKNKRLCQRTTNNEQRTLSKTNPIKPNFKRRTSLPSILSLPRLSRQRLPRQLTIDYLPEAMYSFNRKGKLAVSC
jgi:hypothetical protein